MSQLDSKRLMKATEMRGLGSKVLFNFDDLQERCEDQIRQIRAQAEQILAEAQQQASHAQEDAQEKGFKLGYQRGIEQAQKDIAARIEQHAAQQFDQSFRAALPLLEKAAGQITAERDQWLSHWETSAVRLATSIAEKILRQKIQANPELMLDITREALRLAAGSSQIQLKVNPQDLEVLSEKLSEMTHSVSALGEVQITPDPQISRGGCFVQTRHGFIDARLETQLERITSELLN